MAEMTMIADGLRFPEGPVVMPDGSVILTEIEPGRITRVLPDGSKQTVATPGGGPNGLALGPDGKLYCCNNGGFNWNEAGGYLAPHGIASDYSGGRIERIDIDTGVVEILYKSGDHGCVLRGPNDIVFDAAKKLVALSKKKWLTIDNRVTILYDLKIVVIDTDG